MLNMCKKEIVTASAFSPTTAPAVSATPLPVSAANPVIPAASAGVSSAAGGVSTLTNDQDSQPTVLNQGFYLFEKYLYL